MRFQKTAVAGSAHGEGCQIIAVSSRHRARMRSMPLEKVLRVGTQSQSTRRTPTRAASALQKPTFLSSEVGIRRRIDRPSLGIESAESPCECRGNWLSPASRASGTTFRSVGGGSCACVRAKQNRGCTVPQQHRRAAHAPPLGWRIPPFHHSPRLQTPAGNSLDRPVEQRTQAREQTAQTAVPQDSLGPESQTTIPSTVSSPRNGVSY